MSVRTITLPSKHQQALRDGKHCWWDDSDGREVLLHMAGARPADVYDDALVVELYPSDLDLIESPEGLGVADVTRSTGWTVRLAEAAA